jgi:hypothetical protein
MTNNTNRRTFMATLAAGVAATGCASMSGNPWQTLVDGPTMTNLNGFTQLGEGGWSITDGVLQGKGGKLGYLVTKDSYTDFEIRAEFWADEDCNSGLFMRCQDRNKVGADNAYEVNIFDKRPDPTYGTGAIVDFAKVAQPMPKAANRWNLYEVTAKGDRMVVVLNGQQTVDVRNSKYKSGPLALQSAGGIIRFRKVLIRAI